MRKMWAEIVVEKKWVVLIFVGALSLFFLLEMRHLYFKNRMTDWLPKKDPVTKIFIETGEKFNSNELVMVAIKARSGETFSKPVLQSLSKLVEELGQRKEISYVTSITNIADIKETPEGIEIRDFLEEIPEEEKLDDLKRYALSKESYVNNVISEDGEWLGVAVYVSSGEDPVKVFGEVIKPAFEKYLGGIAEIYYSGEPSDSYFANKFAVSDIEKLVPIILVLIALILFISFRSFKGVVLPFLVVVLSTIWTFGFMALTRTPMNLITPALPVLLIALGSAYGIHVLNKIIHEVREGEDRKESIKKALREIFLPVIMAGATTVAGFLSFLSARLSLIIHFGLFAAAGIAFAMIISLLLIPAAYAAFPFQITAREERGLQFYNRFLTPLFKLVRKHSGKVALTSLLLIVAFAVGVPSIKRKVNFTEYYPKDSQPRVALKIIDDHFAGAFPLTFYLKGENVKSPETLRVMRRLENFLFAFPEASKPFSVVDFLQEINFKLNGRYHIPDSLSAVANLWFFMEGRKELNQVVTEDLREALVFSKVSKIETDYMRSIYERIQKFLKEEVERGFVSYRLEGLERNKIAVLRKAEASYISDEVLWLAEYYGRSAADRNGIRDMLERAVEKMPSLYDEEVRSRSEEVIKDYLFSEEFEFELDRKTLDRLLRGITRLLEEGRFDKSSLMLLFRRAIPSSQFEEDLASDAIDSILYKAEETRREIFVLQTWEEVKRLVPATALQEEGFEKRIKGLLYELADDLVVLPRGFFAGIPGKEVKISKIHQSGFPSVITRLDHFLYISQLQSFALALAITFLLMTLMRGSFVLGGISTIPIIFTLSVIYGFLGFSGIPLDYATMMIAGISIGVGIDYAIHFLHGVVVEADQGSSLEEATFLSFLEKGKAILANSFAVIAGFLVLLLSSMSPLRNLGGTMVGSMFLAALAALTTLPSMILSLKPKIGGKK